MIEPRTVAALKLAVDRAIRTHLCVHAHIGPANALVLGFGDIEPPPDDASPPQPDPPYEFHTHAADWTIESLGERVDTRSSEPDRLQNAVGRLVGRRAIDWRFDGTPTNFDVVFEGGDHLHVTAFPVSELTPADQDSEAWEITQRDGAHCSVTCSGELAVVE